MAINPASLVPVRAAERFANAGPVRSPAAERAWTAAPPSVPAAEREGNETPVRSAAAERHAKQALVRAARSFEALFLQMMLRTMRESQLEDGLFGGGTGAETWDGMFDQMVADSLADSSPLGIGNDLIARWSEQGADEGTAGVDDENSARRLEVSVADDEIAAAVAATSRERARAIYQDAAVPAGVSSPFGQRRDPIDGFSRFHTGADLQAPAGTPVLAVAPGTVRSAGRDGGYGLSVVVEHPDGWTSRYAHLDTSDVRPGDHVPRGSRLGVVGATGRATGPHLHFETRRNGLPIDPGIAAPGPLLPQVLGHPTDER